MNDWMYPHLCYAGGIASQQQTIHSPSMQGGGSTGERSWVEGITIREREEGTSSDFVIPQCHSSGGYSLSGTSPDAAAQSNTEDWRWDVSSWNPGRRDPWGLNSLAGDRLRLCGG